MLRKNHPHPDKRRSGFPWGHSGKGRLTVLTTEAVIYDGQDARVTRGRDARDT